MAGDRKARIVDGTIVKEPGETGSQWRILYSIRVPELRCDFLRLRQQLEKRVNPENFSGNGPGGESRLPFERATLPFGQPTSASAGGPVRNRSRPNRRYGNMRNMWRCSRLTRPRAADIREFWEKGGTIIATTKLPTRSAEFGKDKELQQTIADVFGVGPDTIWNPHTGDQQPAEFTAGEQGGQPITTVHLVLPAVTSAFFVGR